MDTSNFNPEYLDHLKSRQKVLEQIEESKLTAKQFMELKLLQAMENNYDDLEDYANWSEALSEVNLLIQKNIKHHYYK